MSSKSEADRLSRLLHCELSVLARSACERFCTDRVEGGRLRAAKREAAVSTLAAATSLEVVDAAGLLIAAKSIFGNGRLDRWLIRGKQRWKKKTREGRQKSWGERANRVR